MTVSTFNAARSERVLAGLGIGVLALHVIDDSFLQPQPGTSAGDHLVAGLVPLVALLGLATIYSRLRAGARAAIAIPLGLLGIVGGVGEAGYYSLEAGPSGDDYTGLLALAAGLMLVGLGATTLWRSRRTDDKLPRRYLRRVMRSTIAAVAAYVVLFPFALSYVFTHSARAVVPAARLGAAYENVSFTTGDGLTLRGWYVPSSNRAAVIAAPGRAGSQKPARMLARHGYGVLLFDRRGEGESDGDPNAFGWAADKDLDAAVAFLQQRPDVDRNRIGGIGLSVGGEDRCSSSTASTIKPTCRSSPPATTQPQASPSNFGRSPMLHIRAASTHVRANTSSASSRSSTAPFSASICRPKHELADPSVQPAAKACDARSRSATTRSSSSSRGPYTITMLAGRP